MKIIIQLQYSLTDSRVFYDVKKSRNQVSTQPNPTHGWTQPMTNSAVAGQKIWLRLTTTSVQCLRLL